jgi:glycosyltransferase involved in cell wall biosynthesis
MMRFLYCLFPLHGYDGYSVVARDLLEYLASKGHEVDCALLVEHRTPNLRRVNKPLERNARHILFYEHPAVRSRGSWWINRLVNRLTPRATGGRHFCPPGFYRALAGHFDLSRYDVAIAASAKFSLLPRLLSCPTVVDLHELFSHKTRLLARHGVPCLSPYRDFREEVTAIKRFDVVWCPSTYIRRVLERVRPGTICIDRHITFRSVVPEGYAPPPVRTEGPPRLLFVGSTAAENVPGLVQFLQEIFPSIRRRIPSVEFHIVGWTRDQLPPNVDATNVVARGRLATREEVLAAFAATDVVVIPRFLGGITVKGVEALSLGKTTVGHEAAFSGCYRIENGKHAVIARSNAEFAAAVVELLEDPARRAAIARNAWEFSQHRFAPERAYEDLFQGLEAFRRLGRGRIPATTLESPTRGTESC